MYHTGDTIEETLRQIERHDLVLPAIQREFVWTPDQICEFFDSLMQGFPFGTFLYWKVSSENSNKFNFYDFVREYHERDNRHCPQLAPMPDRALTVVLDGQQRLTALNVSLRGSMTRKLPRLWWKNPEAWPKRHLYLDLLWKAEVDGDERDGYRFRFRCEHDPRQPKDAAGNVSECWFRVSEVLMMDGGPPMLHWLLDKGLDKDALDQAFQTLDRLHAVVRKDRLVAFYEERRQALDDVLQIFIRMNSGGTPLSHSDLLLSIAVAQWTEYDAREEIHKLVDDLNRIGLGFSFSKDLVLKAGLMLSDKPVGFKVDNFNRKNMADLQDRWMSIKLALTLTVQLVAGLGFSQATLTLVRHLVT